MTKRARRGLDTFVFNLDGNWTLFLFLDLPPLSRCMIRLNTKSFVFLLFSRFWHTRFFFLALIMKWLRSAEMEYISLIVNEDAAHDCVQKLGDLGVLEFTDLNPELTPFQRRYVNYVKRCDEMERKLRYFEVELAKFSITPRSAGSLDQFIAGSADIRYGSQDTATRALDTLERKLEDKEQELVQLNAMHEKLTREFNERKELQEIISRAGEFFEIESEECR